MSGDGLQPSEGRRRLHRLRAGAEALSDIEL